MVRKSIIRRELVEKIHRIIKINQTSISSLDMQLANSTRAFYSRAIIIWSWHTNNAWMAPGCEFDRDICGER